MRQGRCRAEVLAFSGLRENEGPRIIPPHTWEELPGPTTVKVNGIAFIFHRTGTGGWREGVGAEVWLFHANLISC